MSLHRKCASVRKCFGVLYIRCQNKQKLIIHDFVICFVFRLMRCMRCASNIILNINISFHLIMGGGQDNFDVTVEHLGNFFRLLIPAKN